MNLIKNISKSEVHVLKDQVTYQEGQVVSKTLAQNDAVSITLFAFDKDEAISTHESGGDAFVTCLDGVGRITIDGVEYILHEGESIVMPAKQPRTARFDGFVEHRKSLRHNSYSILAVQRSSRERACTSQGSWDEAPSYCQCLCTKKAAFELYTQSLLLFIL